MLSIIIMLHNSDILITKWPILIQQRKTLRQRVLYWEWSYWSRFSQILGWNDSNINRAEGLKYLQWSFSGRPIDFLSKSHTAVEGCGETDQLDCTEFYHGLLHFQRNDPRQNPTSADEDRSSTLAGRLQKQMDSCFAQSHESKLSISNNKRLLVF